jgi:hypothetical protein
MPVDTVEEPVETNEPATFKQSVRDRLDSVVSRATTQEHVESEPVMASWVASSLKTTVRMSEPVVDVVDEEQDELDKLNSFVSERIPLGKIHANAIEPEPLATESHMADALAEQSIHAFVDSTVTDSSEKIVEETPGKKKRSRKPLPAGYGYALECLLLGISVLVLVTTQRSSMRNRSSHSSQHRVA